MLGWKQGRSLHLTVFPLVIIWGMGRPPQVTHYLLLCLEKEFPRGPDLLLRAVVWTKPGFVPALQAHHSLDVQPLPPPRPLQLLPQPPCLPFTARIRSAVTKWLSPLVCAVFRNEIIQSCTGSSCTERMPLMSIHSHRAGPLGEGNSFSQFPDVCQKHGVFYTRRK